MQTITLQKKEVANIKKQENKIDWGIVAQFRRAMEDIKQGRIREWNPKEAKK